MAEKFNGLDPKTNALVFADGTPRPPGIDPETRQYSTAQMLFDEMYGGDTEGAHALADDLICKVLRELGYGEGIDAFEAMHKWYA